MAQDFILVGGAANDGTGDSLRVASGRINNNFTELYARPSVLSDIGMSGNNIISKSSNADIVLKPSGVSSVTLGEAIKIEGNNIKGMRSNDDMRFIPSGTGKVVFAGIGFDSGTSISAVDSTTVNINENVINDGALNVSGASEITGAVTLGSTLGVTGATTLSSMTVTGNSTLSGTTTIDNLTFNDNIIASTSNADIRLEPGGTGAVVISNLTLDSNVNITDNEIKTTTSNSDLILNASGTGDLIIGAVKIRGTTLSSNDSSSININEALVVDGTATISSAVTLDSTLNVTSDVTVTGNLVVSGNTSITGPFPIDNLSFNDNIISSTSNADIDFAPGGTGSVNISNLTIDSNLVLKDNNIVLSSSNADIVLSASGTGSVNISKIDMDEGTVDNTVIGATTGAAGTFTTLTFNPVAGGTLNSTGVAVTDNTITARLSNDNLQFNPSGTGNVSVNGFTFPNSDGGTGQFIKTNGSKVLSFDTVPIAFNVSNVSDAKTTISFGSDTVIDHVTSLVKHELISSSTVTIDSFLTSKYDSAFYLGVSRDDVSDEFEVFKTSLVHNDSDAFISTSAVAKTGTNNHTTVTADISSGTVRLRGTGSSPTNSLAMYRIGLGDNDSSGYSGEQEASVLVDSELSHMTETAVNGVIATGSHTLVTGSTQTTVNQFATSKYDSAWYLAVSKNDLSSDEFEISKVSVVHNNSSAFAANYANTKTDTGAHTTFDADINDSNVRLRATAGTALSTFSYYRIGLGDNDSTGYSGEQEATIEINTDLDSTLETLDEWAKADFRGAKYYISINDASKTELSNIECVVVHDGTNAMITSYGNVDTGNNTLIELTADINGSNVRLRATGNTPNLRVHMYRILLADDEADRTGTNVNVIGEVTVSSSATALDTFNTDTDDSATLVHGAHYIIVAFNSSEGAASICEAAVVSDGTGAYVSQYAQTSTKSTGQITLTAAHDGSNTVTLSAASTSGASTTVNAYRVNLTAPSTIGTTATLDSFAKGSFRGAKYYISMNDLDNNIVQNKEILIVHDGTDSFMNDYNNVRSATISTPTGDLVAFTTSISGSNVILTSTLGSANTGRVRIHAYRVLLADNEADRTGTHVNVSGDVTVSSSATTIDTFDNIGADGSTSIQAAHYIVVANNSSESASSICEAAVVAEGTNAFITQYAQVSTKATGQITLTAVHDGSSTVQVKAASTSGGSTKVNAYRVNLTRAAGSSSAVATLDTNSASSVRSIKYLIQSHDTVANNYELLEANVTHDGTTAYISTFGKISDTSTDLVTYTADIDSGNLRLRGTLNSNNDTTTTVMRRAIDV